MPMNGYKKAVGKALTTAMTVDDGAALFIVYTGSTDSAGGIIWSTDSDFYLYVGTDSDDSTVTDSTINTDYDTDAVSSDGVFSTDYPTTLTLGEVKDVIDYSPNWHCVLVNGLYEDIITLATLENTTDATEITRTSGLYIDFDKSDTNTTVGSTDLVGGETSTDVVQVRVTISPEWDLDIDGPLARVSAKRDLPYMPEPGSSDMSTTRTSEGPVYVLTDQRTKCDFLSVSVTATDTTILADSDSIPSGNIDLYVLSASQTGERIIFKDTTLHSDATSDTTSVAKEYDANDLAACISDPGERAVVVLASTNTDANIKVTANGTYGDWQAY